MATYSNVNEFLGNTYSVNLIHSESWTHNLILPYSLFRLTSDVTISCIMKYNAKHFTPLNCKISEWNEEWIHNKWRRWMWSFCLSNNKFTIFRICCKILKVVVAKDRGIQSLNIFIPKYLFSLQIFIEFVFILDLVILRTVNYFYIGKTSGIWKKPLFRISLLVNSCYFSKFNIPYEWINSAEERYNALGF